MAEPPHSDPEALLGFARELAAAAAAATLPLFRSGLAVDNKAECGFDPVTQADRAAEQAMRSLIAARYPTHGIRGEEYAARAGAAAYEWVLDPIDGTGAFLCGMPTWSTLIGLLREGAPLLGIMSQPFVGERFEAGPHGAYRIGGGIERRLRTRPAESLGAAVLATTCVELYAEAQRRAAFDRLRRAVRFARYGGDAYFYCLLAAGHIDIAIDPGLKPYDIVALIPIIEQAGGVVTTWRGGPATAGGDVLAAASAALHDAALEILNS
jgi:histidinol phosphatase-like enzyme (inositol monophosphatase family)